MMRIRCNFCDSVFNEDQIIINEADPYQCSIGQTEFCPVCKKAGYLMDLFDPDDYDDSTPKGQRLHMALSAAYELTDNLEHAMGHPNDKDAEWMVNHALESVIFWTEKTYPKKEEVQ